jgi:hypothetical protein
MPSTIITEQQFTDKGNKPKGGYTNNKNSNEFGIATAKEQKGGRTRTGLSSLSMFELY